jgi:hypothetical protein
MAAADHVWHPAPASFGAVDLPRWQAAAVDLIMLIG